MVDMQVEPAEPSGAAQEHRHIEKGLLLLLGRL